MCVFVTLVALCWSAAISAHPSTPAFNPAEETGPIISISGGQILGREVNVLNGSVDVFLGIPFAKPPLGELRFRRPLAPDKWSGVRNCQRPGSICVQHLNIGGVETVDRGSEDCLFLNVFVPRRRDIETQSTNSLEDEYIVERENGAAYGGENKHNDSKKLSVFVYIHGGSFAVGSGSEDRFNGTVLSVVAKIIVVTINYRQGYFGFSYSGTEESPGNCGIYDMIAALQWVQLNIGFFGGDVDSVTLGGNSAGAISGGFLSYSPLTRGLFQRAILVSGTPLISATIAASKESAINFTMQMAEVAECEMSNSSDVHGAIRCLKWLPTEKLNEVQSSFSTFGPLLDELAIIGYGENVLDELANRSMDFLLGVTKNDGSFLLFKKIFEFIENRRNLTITHDQLQKVIAARTSQLNPYKGQRLSIQHQYNNWLNPSDGAVNLEKAEELATDTAFICPAVKFARQLSRRGLRSYIYQFNHRSFATTWPAFPGVHHTSDIGFIFGHPLRLPGYSESEIELSLLVMKHFGNFVTNGDPSLEDNEWPVVSNIGAKYKKFGIDNSEIEFGPRAQECALWNTILPAMDDDCSNRASNSDGAVKFKTPEVHVKGKPKVL